MQLQEYGTHNDTQFSSQVQNSTIASEFCYNRSKNRNSTHRQDFSFITMQNHIQNILGKLSPRGRFKKWLAFWVLLFLVGWGVYFLFDFLEPERVLVTISKETTYITAPIKSSGYPDYEAAFNKMQSEGVTPKNNIYVPILRAMGPNRTERGGRMFNRHEKKVIPDEIASEFYRQLGIEPLDPTDQYLESYEDYLKSIPNDQLPPPNDEEKQIENEEYRFDKIRLRLDQQSFSNAVWDPQKYVLAEKWFAKQEPILKRLEGIEKRTKLFVPRLNMIPENYLLMSESPHFDHFRSIGYVILSRGARNLYLKQHELAWKDCQLLLQIAKLLQNGPTMIDVMVGSATEGIGEVLLNRIVHDPEITMEKLKLIQKTLMDLDRPRYDRAFDTGERLIYLDMVSHAAEWGFDPHEKERFTQPHMSFRQRKKIDYDFILIHGNRLFDDQSRWLSIDDPEMREKIKFPAMEEYREHEEAFSKRGKVDKVLDFFQSRASLSRQMSFHLQDITIHPLGSIHLAMKKRLMEREINLAGIALAIYHKKHGKYPTDFTELQSEGIKGIPFDPWNNKPCIYKSDGEGFLLYAIGVNETDEGGAGEEFDDGSDDIAVYSLNRVPKPPEKPKESGDSESPHQMGDDSAPDDK